FYFSPGVAPAGLAFPYQPAAAPIVAPLSLHDALPISRTLSRRGPAGGRHRGRDHRRRRRLAAVQLGADPGARRAGAGEALGRTRSEEHTSELQSREKLVCRLLLEKKKLGLVGVDVISG